MKNNNLLIVFLAVALAVPASGAENLGVDFDGKTGNASRFVLADLNADVSVVPAVTALNKGYIAENDPAVLSGAQTLVEWVAIPGGKFLMGTEDFEDTRPIHEVAIKPFEMSKALITTEQYAECVRKKKCYEPGTGYFSGFYCNWGATGREKHPINCITWDRANQYAAFVGARLPTEAEWEYSATSGGKNQKYPWGNSNPSVDFLPTHPGSMPVVAPVCSKPLGNTEQGLCDMTGNLQQYVQDSYEGTYRAAPSDGGAVISAGKEKVLRGAPIGSSSYEIPELLNYYRSDRRTYTTDSVLYGYSPLVGFRLARSLSPIVPIDWVTIPGGKFKMGTSGFVPGFEDTKPAHDVSIKAFEMSKTDVTVGQYLECVSKGKCTAPDAGEGCNWAKPGRQEHPVNCVDWNQANQYAEFAGARLPSEAEWEYAARSGGKDNTYPWGNSLPVTDLLVMNAKGTAAVCSRPAGNTEQGLCDMGGNVFQWVQDKYVNSYEGAPVDGSPVENGGPLRGLRGSSFNNANESLMRSVYRFATAPGYRYDIFGFRLARVR